jgi:hypothetical protein
MKKLILFLLLFSFALNLNSQTTREYSMMLEAKVESKPSPKITIMWNKNPKASRYEVWRTESAITKTTFLGTIDTSKLEYVDNDIKAGSIYEYNVRAITKYPGKSPALEVSAIGYITSSVGAEPSYNSGKVLLLIDKTMKESLKNEIARLIQDMKNEGMTVIEKYVPRSEKFNKDSVTFVKNIVLAEYAKDEINLSTIFILGRVPVPYSGDLNPDAHPDHKGAWPCDMYYGSMDESRWQDWQVTSSGTSRDENKNISGDGKFDLTTLPNDMNIQLQVGRVDMFNMPAFKDSETELLRKYLDKDHKYRIGETKPKKQALISDNFGVLGDYEAFASSGWRGFPLLVGKDNVTTGTWFDKLGTDSYLAAYGCGGGSYSSCSGLGTTTDFTTKPVNAVFILMFGSYFGDWDSQNNILRAPLASQPNALTCAWDGRPNWFMNDFAFGETIGSEANKAMNNNGSSYAYVLLRQFQGTDYTQGGSGPGAVNNGMNRKVHIALMGDPTLRLNEFSNVIVPTNLSIFQKGYKSIELNWSCLSGDVDYEFDIYRKTDPNSVFVKINSKPVITKTYIDNFNFAGDVQYMVRTRELQVSPSGSRYNYSLGATNTATLKDLTDVTEVNSNKLFSVTPTVVSNNCNITYTLPNENNINIDVLDVSGQIVKTLVNGMSFSGSINWDLNNASGNRVSPGVYFVRMNNSGNTSNQKIIVMP